MFHILAIKEARLLIELLSSFSKDETIISKSAFKAMYEQLPQTREEVDLRTYKQSIFFGVILSTNMVMRVHICSIHHKPCNQHGQKKGHTF